MTLVLASGSPRRLALLREAGVAPVVAPADVDETPRPGEPPRELVRRLAVAKATAVDGDLVLGSDTEVVRGGEVLGKPRDEDDALRMLRASSGRALVVWSGVAVAGPQGVATRVVGTLLRFAELDHAAAATYVATGEPMGVAGAFRIQGRGAALVVERHGCWTNVVGLPVCATAALLAPHGLRLRSDGCQTSAAS